MDGSVRESRKSWARVVFYVKNKNLDLVRRDLVRRDRSGVSFYLVRRDRSLVAFSKRFDETSPLNDTMDPSPCFPPVSLFFYDVLFNIFRGIGNFNALVVMFNNFFKGFSRFGHAVCTVLTHPDTMTITLCCNDYILT